MPTYVRSARTNRNRRARFRRRLNQPHVLARIARNRISAGMRRHWRTTVRARAARAVNFPGVPGTESHDRMYSNVIPRRFVPDPNYYSRRRRYWGVEGRY